jgi:hypothetical protein
MEGYTIESVNSGIDNMIKEINKLQGINKELSETLKKRNKELKNIINTKKKNLCEYCQLVTKDDKKKDFDIGFFQGFLEVGYTGTNESERVLFKINYCLWCGRKLKHEE